MTKKGGIKIMCSPSMPKVSNKKQPEIATPTIADATVTKASEKTMQKASNLADKDVKTSSRGLGDEAKTKKKNLLGE